MISYKGSSTYDVTVKIEFLDLYRYGLPPMSRFSLGTSLKFNSASQIADPPPLKP